MSLYDYAGLTAARTLGYIHGNHKGAYWAGMAYQMAPILKRKYNEYATPPRTPNKRTKSFSQRSMKGARRMLFKKPSRSRRKGGFSHPRNSTTAGKSIKRNRKVRYKRVPKVKIGKKFRAKVQKIISGRTYPGFYHSVFFNSFNVTLNNGQALFTLSFDNLSEYSFTPNQFLNAASILWNGKAVVTTGPSIADSFNFDPKTSKIFVKKSWTVTQLRNNTQRTMYLKMFNCRPKSDQNNQTASGQWAAALVEMAASGAGGAFSENPLAVTPNTLHTDPRSLVQWNKYYTAEVTKYVLDPGQVVDYVVQGPANMELDYAKFYNGGTYQQIQKMSRHQFGVLYEDMVSGTLGGSSRLADPTTGVGLLWECNAYYMLDLPDKAGIVGPTLGVLNGTPLQERHNAYAVYVNSPVIGTPLYRIDEENPALTTFL